VARWHEIEAALARWRAAEQRVLCSGAEGTDAMRAAVEIARHAYHLIAAAHMSERLEELRDDDASRAASTGRTQCNEPWIDGADRLSGGATAPAGAGPHDDHGQHSLARREP